MRDCGSCVLRFPSARILSLEKSRPKLALLRANTRSFPNVVVVHGYLSHKERKVGTGSALGTGRPCLSTTTDIPLVLQFPNYPSGARRSRTLHHCHPRLLSPPLLPLMQEPSSSLRRSVRVSGPFLSHLLGVPSFDVLRLNPLAAAGEDVFACQTRDRCDWMRAAQGAIIDNVRTEGSGSIRSRALQVFGTQTWEVVGRDGSVPGTVAFLGLRKRTRG